MKLTRTVRRFAELIGVAAPAQIGTGTPGAGKYVDGDTGAWTALPGGGSTVYSNPGAGTNSERFGASAATGSQVNASAFGQGATVNNTNGQAFGQGATVNGQYSVAIGQGATSNGDNSVAAGNGSISQHNGLVVGGGAAISGGLIDCIGVGVYCSVAHNQSIVLGRSGASTAANQFTVGSSAAPMNQMTFASGMTPIADSAAANCSLFVSSDHSNKLCWKDSSGTVTPLY